MDELISERAVAKILSISYSTMKKLRLKGEGPEYFRFGPRTVRYYRADVAKWIDGKIEKGKG